MLLRRCIRIPVPPNPRSSRTPEFSLNFLDRLSNPRTGNNAISVVFRNSFINTAHLSNRLIPLAISPFDHSLFRPESRLESSSVFKLRLRLPSEPICYHRISLCNFLLSQGAGYFDPLKNSSDLPRLPVPSILLRYISSLRCASFTRVH